MGWRFGPVALPIYGTKGRQLKVAKALNDLRAFEANLHVGQSPVDLLVDTQAFQADPRHEFEPREVPPTTMAFRGTAQTLAIIVRGSRDTTFRPVSPS